MNKLKEQLWLNYLGKHNNKQFWYSQFNQKLVIQIEWLEIYLHQNSSQHGNKRHLQATAINALSSYYWDNQTQINTEQIENRLYIIQQTIWKNHDIENTLW